jgi:ferredoxin
MECCVISFPNSTFPPLTLPIKAKVADYLTIENSPILFGCRTGLCGTCLVKVTGKIPPPQPEESEILEIFAPQDSQARLACQIKLTGDITIARYQADEV